MRFYTYFFTKIRKKQVLFAKFELIFRTCYMAET